MFLCTTSISPAPPKSIVLYNMYIQKARTSFEWDPGKAHANFQKAEICFSETAPVFNDDFAITITDDASNLYQRRLNRLERA